MPCRVFRSAYRKALFYFLTAHAVARYFTPFRTKKESALSRDFAQFLILQALMNVHVQRYAHTRMAQILRNRFQLACMLDCPRGECVPASMRRKPLARGLQHGFRYPPIRIIAPHRFSTCGFEQPALPAIHAANFSKKACRHAHFARFSALAE